MDEPIESLLQRALAIRTSGRRPGACLIVKAKGSTPRAAGALMLVDDETNTWGTVGGGCVEAEVRQRAVEMLARGESGVLQFTLDRDYGWDDGMICGGTLEIAIAPLPEPDVLRQTVDDIAARRSTLLPLWVNTKDGPVNYALGIEPRDRLYVVGAGHVGQAVTRLALRLDFDVTLFDDRADLLERFGPDGAHLVSGDVAARLKESPIDHGTYCVLVSRGPGHDEQALTAVIGRGAKYIGMIGSRRKARVMFDDLRKRGLSAEALDAIHVPIGLDIGAVTVEEIALSIAGQLVECRRTDMAPIVEGPTPISVPAP